MALPNFGAGVSLSMQQVNTELGVSPNTTQISLNQSTVRALFQKTTAGSAISLFDGFGKSSAVAASVSSYTSTPSYRCLWYDFDNEISWYLNAGTGNITITLQRAPISSCTWADAANLGTYNAPGWINVDANNYWSGGFNVAFRLKMVNSVGTTYSPGIGVVWMTCNEFDYCSQNGPDCNDNQTWGCHNCSETCNCNPCSYDCNCDNSYGYGTGGCSCDPGACDYCNNSQNYECTGCCTGCCDENNENCTCDCSCDCGWVSNPNYPCLNSQVTCSEDCYCPCGNSCGNGDRYTCQEQQGPEYSSSYSAC